MVQDDGHLLASALFGVLWRMRRIPLADGVDRGALLVLGEAAQMAPVRASALAAEIRLDLSTVSRHLKSLADAGLIVRSTDSSDARAQVITVTEAGITVLASALQARAEALAPAVADWDDADITTLRDLLERLADDLTPTGAPSLDRHHDLHLERHTNASHLNQHQLKDSQ